MTAWTESYLFGIVLSIFAFALGVFLNRKTRLPLFNPLLVATALVILVLSLLRIPLDNYRKGAKFISVFLAPATAALAVSVYNQRRILQKYFAPVLIGCLMGSLASMGSAYLLCKAFGLEDALVATMLPKSVTTPIAMAVSETLGGIVPVTVAAVILTGILGAMIAPLLIKTFHVTDPIAQGVAIGTCSHAIGTTKAMELGELQGAMSSIAIGVAGLMTVLISLFL